jgi:hypothetical protein
LHCRRDAPPGNARQTVEDSGPTIQTRNATSHAGVAERTEMVTYVEAQPVVAAQEEEERAAAWAHLLRDAGALYGRVAAGLGESYVPLGEDERHATARLAAAVGAPIDVAAARLAAQRRRAG